MLTVLPWAADTPYFNSGVLVIDTARWKAGGVGLKAIAYAEQNVQASLDHAQSLLKAKDLSEVMRLHSEYVQAQMRSLAEQAGEMGQVVGKAAMDAAKPKA